MQHHHPARLPVLCLARYVSWERRYGSHTGRPLHGKKDEGGSEIAYAMDGERHALGLVRTLCLRRDEGCTYRLWGLFTNDEVARWQNDEDKEGCGQREGCVDQHIAEARMVPIEACHMMGDGHGCQHLRMTSKP